MNNEALRQACEEFSSHWLLCASERQELEAFARQMQAVGVRSAKEEMARLDRCTEMTYSDAVDQLMDWCDAEAKRLEQP